MFRVYCICFILRRTIRNAKSHYRRQKRFLIAYLRILHTDCCSLLYGVFMSLDHAPDHIKLAVDLIELLESHDIEPSVAVGALTIALRDFQAKLESIDKK